MTKVTLTTSIAGQGAACLADFLLGIGTGVTMRELAESIIEVAPSENLQA